MSAGASGAYVTLAAPASHQQTIQASRFTAHAQRADTPEEALAQLAGLRAQFPDATHHCWAYRIGAAYRFSDDGEPGGSAGAPILRATEGQGLDHVMVVVVRDYGGVKLGVGGLVRAYSGVTAECLRLAERLTVRPRVTVLVQVGFEHVSALYHLLGGLDVERGAEGYDERGLTLSLSLFPEDRPAFERALGDSTRGQALVEVVEESP